jgi:uncharacterized protein
MAALGPFGDSVSVLPAAFSPWFQARCPDIPLEGAVAVLDLAAGGARAPFIARYRRDRTGNLDEAAVRRTIEAGKHWDRLVGRQAIILESIERHATITPELREKIVATFDADGLEDLYLPYKQKKKSRAIAAREAGLGLLADWIWSCGHGTETPQEGQTLELWAFTFRAPEKGVPDAKTAIEGARDILVERLAEDAGLRAHARRAYAEKGWLRATKTEKAKPGSRFEAFFDLHEKVASLREASAAHRYLAVRRGQSEGELLLAITGPPDDAEFEAGLIQEFESAAVTVPDSPGAEVLRQASRIAFKGLVRNAMENDIHRVLKETADAAAARAYAENVRRLLMEAPFGPKPVLGIDPGVRAGSPLAVVDAGGACVASGLIRLQTDEEKAAAREAVQALVGEHEVAGVAVGHGAAGREAEIFLRSALREAGREVPVVLVKETGASGYAASEIGRTELPDVDAGVRAAAFIARRLQDPLRELVKLEPRSIAGRQHAHDVAPSTLIRELIAVLESCVGAVGVDVNTAPRPLLARVCGIDPTLAAAIVEHREAKGPFRSKQQLLDVPRLGPKVFAQAAGFLRVPGGQHPLDATAVHPDRYAILESFAERHGKTVGELLGPGVALAREAADLEPELGRWTREHVLSELETPGRDPRGSFVPFSFREDVQKLEDLKPGLVCPGLVTNVTTFGVFVDLGLSHEGLVHVSQLGRRSTKDPPEAIRPGDRVQARVLKVDQDKRQISLSLKPAPAPPRPSPPRPSPPRPSPPRGVDRPAPRPKGASAGSARRPSRARGDGDARREPRRERPAPPAGSGRRPGEKPARDRRPAFNNPFAVLADLKLPKRDKS